jgi:hypothetical protein
MPELISNLPALIGIITGLIIFFTALVQGLVRAPNLITPENYRDEQTKAHPVAVGEFAPDLAWPFYPYRQARTDLGRVSAEWTSRYGRIAKWPLDAFFRGRHGSRFWWWFFFPIPVLTLWWLAVTGLTALACFAVFAVVNVAGAAVIGAIHGALAGLVRGWEQIRRTRVHAEVSCPKCFHVSKWPAYQCPACETWHRDIRTGKLGLFIRRCQCGNRLPTMPLRAAWRLQAICQHDKCEQALPPGTGALRDVRIVIFGDTSAGKSRFLYASLNSLIAGGELGSPPVDFPDTETRQQVGLGLDAIRTSQDTVKTPTALPFAVTCRLGIGRRATLAQLFDTAGENYQDASLHDSLGFLHEAHGFVYVLDPFSIPWVRNRLAGNNTEAVRLAHAAAGNPESSYSGVVTRIRDAGAAADRQRLAVIISKTDLLRASGLQIPTGSTAIAAWLREAGMHNVVIGAQRDFAQVRYFTVASAPVTPDSRQDDPGTPLRWLLRAYGTALPGPDGTEDAADRAATSAANPQVPETAKAAT